MEIKRGDIYYADLSPVVGSEQDGVRPVLCIQNDIPIYYNVYSRRPGTYRRSSARCKAFGGGAVIEMVFAYPGVGKLLLDAIENRDTTLACGCIVLQTTITVVVLLIVDLLYAFVDPRVKAQYVKGGKKK